MPGDVVGGHGRASQDELVRLGPVVALSADSVPQCRGVLPLVEQAGSGAGQHCRRSGLRQQLDGRVVNTGLTASEAAGRPGLAARPRTINEYGPYSPESAGDVGFSEAGTVIGHGQPAVPGLRVAHVNLFWQMWSESCPLIATEHTVHHSATLA